MEESEDIETYFLHNDEVVNTMRGLEEKVKYVDIVQKVRRSLLVRFNSKISALEERDDIATLEMDEVHGILTSYEMRNSGDDYFMKEVAFKATKKGKKKVEAETSNHEDSKEDKEEANFVKNLKMVLANTKVGFLLSVLVVVE